MSSTILAKHGRIFSILVFLFFTTQLASSQTCVTRDRDALLSFKNALIDSGGQLRSWNKKGNCCDGFVGVSCNSNGEVVYLSFAAEASEDDCDDDCHYIVSKKPGQNLIGTTLSKLSAMQTFNLSFIILNDVFPTGLSALENLTVLSLRNLGFHGTISDDIGKIDSLKYLSLNQIQGPYPSSLCNLSNLETLDFSQTPESVGIQPGGPIPSCIGNLQKLKNLLLELNGLTGSIPDSVRNLQALKALKVTGNKLSGTIPAFLGELSALEDLFLQGNNWTGSIPASLGALSHLKDLRFGGLDDLNSELVYSMIEGTIPSSFAMLTKLQTLIIRGTRVAGPLPAWLGNATLLTDLELDHNQLSDTVPPELGTTNLTTLFINDNYLSGPLPAAIGNLTFLANFAASRNAFSGSIPESFVQLAFCEGGVLDLSHNYLSGTIPSNLGLAVGSGMLDLSYNSLNGSLNPASLTSFRTVILNNNLFTSFLNASLSNDEGQSLVTLDVHSNRLTGPIPPWPFQQSYLETLDLSDNELTEVPPFTGSGLSISYLNLSINNISGGISDEFTKLSAANTIDLSKNQFSGSIPRNFSSAFQFLNNLILGENQLTGTIPSTIFNSTFLNVLILNKNQLTGPIPLQAGGDLLNYVDFSNNLLAGSIPSALFRNSALLNTVKLSNNRLTGLIPSFTPSCTSLQHIILENNQLTGLSMDIEGSASTCTSLQVYDVSGNLLTGTIPPGVGELSVYSLSSTTALNFSHNSFTGAVDASIAELQGLRVLDLANKFSGPIPASIADITDLKDLNLEYNNFSGHIPEGLQKFPVSDFAHNPQLCGAPLPKKCP